MEDNAPTTPAAMEMAILPVEMHRETWRPIYTNGNINRTAAIDTTSSRAQLTVRTRAEAPNTQHPGQTATIYSYFDGEGIRNIEFKTIGGKEPKLRAQAQKLRDFIISIYTESGNRKIIASIDELAAREGRPYKKVRADVGEDLETLLKVRYNFEIQAEGTGKRERPIKKVIRTMIFDTEPEISNRCIVATLSQSFIDGLYAYGSTHWLMHYPDALYKTNDQYFPNAFFIGRFLCEQWRQHAGRILRVSSIYPEHTPKIPTREQLAKMQRPSVYREVMARFSANMDELARCGLLDAVFLDDKDPDKPPTGWKYCNKGGAPLTDPDRREGLYKLETWQNYYIKYQLKDVPVTLTKAEERQLMKQAKEDFKANYGLPLRDKESKEIINRKYEELKAAAIAEKEAAQKALRK